MIRFDCDYGEGAHPLVLKKLADTNLEQTPGYGEDIYCQQAGDMIRAACQKPQAAVHFLTGGTQTNLTVIAALLRPHQGVLCAQSGHINVHETGAIEAAGHKVLALPSTDGKLTAGQIEQAWHTHFSDDNRERTVQPGMVFLSFPTEMGGIYTKQELDAISRVCRRRGLPLYIDGARLGYGLCAPGCDLDLPSLAALCDAFYIGGTKQGALFGEALVINSPALGADFRYIMKQRGAMLAKGRLLGLQFIALLEDGLYFSLARHAVAQAMRIRQAVEQAGLPLLAPSCTNQQFPIFPNTWLQKLEEQFAFTPWGRVDKKHSAVRLCTSWATRPQDVDAFCQAIAAGPEQ